MDSIMNNQEKNNIGDILNEEFKNYNEAAPLGSDFFDENEAVVDKLKSNTNAKVASAKRIVSLAAGLVNQKLQDANANIVLINVEDTFSSNSRDARITTKIKINDQDKVVDVHVNFNAKKMLNLPPQEFYSVVSALLYSSILSKSLEGIGGLAGLEKQSEENQPVQMLRDQYDGVKVVRNADNKTVNKDASEKIKSYLARFLSKYMDDNNYELDEIAEVVADEIASTGKSTESILSSMFDLSMIRDFDDDSLDSARNSRLLSYAEEEMESFDMLAALTYEQQAEELLSVRTKSNFESMRNSENIQVMANFCVSFVSEFLKSNGLANAGVMLTFNRTGVPGTFNNGENGQPKTINIDLYAVKSITDLVMTMSHEVTHCIDSYKPAGEKSSNGLEGSMEYDDIKSLGLNRGSPESKFLRKIHSYCYHLDPAERRARQGELAGLRFMQNLAATDPSLQEDVLRNIKKFERYQDKTMKMVNTLTGPNADSFYKNLLSEYNSMKASLSPEVAKSIETRLDYLDKLMKEGIVSNAQEMQSVATAKGIRNEMMGLPKESSNNQRGL